MRNDPPRQRPQAPRLPQGIPETDGLAAWMHDALALPASPDRANESALNGHKFPSIRQVLRQPVRERRTVIIRGLISQCAFPEAAKSSLHFLNPSEQQLL